MKVNLEGKFALVTGAARGIGQAIADMLTANGARVAYADIDVATVQQTAANKPGALAVAMDISNESSVQSAMAEIHKQFGRLDILVNNAGVNTAKHRVNIDQFPLEEWERILKIDLTGTFLVSQAASRIMLKQQEGRIINIASVLGVVPARLQCAFTSAKAGVAHLTRTLAIELGEHGILVNCVAPGSTLTEGTKQLFYSESASEKDRAKRVLSHIPLGRAGTVEEMAHAVLFFAAPESSYISGQTLCVDGGWSAGGFFRDF
ncbi:MAG: short-chain dehydrogenase [Acidobacteriales bacterium 59-55]|nr:glucose 1-dehydrogenase [Terriglobales bacterium]OJV40300.1 MAG: short-chain dehydrogenase [Acidobacteriales bacterium 59-55]